MDDKHGQQLNRALGGALRHGPQEPQSQGRISQPVESESPVHDPPRVCDEPYAGNDVLLQGGISARRWHAPWRKEQHYKPVHHTSTPVRGEAPSGPAYCISRHAPYAHTIGTANSMASMRSSMPPWPGRIVPESFTPAPRFMRDSTRSPNCAAMLTTADSRMMGHSGGCFKPHMPSGRSIKPARSRAELIPGACLIHSWP